MTPDDWQLALIERRRDAALQRIRRNNPRISAREAHRRAEQALQTPPRKRGA